MKKKNNFISIIILCMLLLALWDSTSVYGKDSGYDSFNKRDPFVPLVGISPERNQSGIAGILSIEDVHLQGILLDSNGDRNVIVNGEMLKEGDGENLFFIEEIKDNVVRVRIGQDKHDILLYE